MISTQLVQKLSSSKQRLSLGEVKKAEKEKKKANTRKAVRSTVVNSNDYEWPTITPEDADRLISCLKTDLKCLNHPNHTVPLNEIRKVKKEERREFRRKWLAHKDFEIGFNRAAYNQLRGTTLQGVNSVSTALDLDIVASIVIEKDVDPPILTKLLVPLANSKKVPIVAIHGLKPVCKEAFNTGCIALGFKKPCDETQHSFYRISQIIRGISKADKTEDTPNNISLTEANNSGPSAVDSISKNGDNHPSGNYFKPPKIRKL